MVSLILAEANPASEMRWYVAHLHMRIAFVFAAVNSF
jgi:hypothetical protein